MALVAVGFALLILPPCVPGAKVCPKCGDIDVPYPLSTQQDCGLSIYGVICDNNVLQFKSQGGSSYRILSISSSTNKLVISVPKISAKMCYSSDLMEGGLKLDESSPFNISNDNTVMLFNCSDNILFSPLNCSSNSPCRVFEQEEREGRACRNTLCCSYLKDASMTAHRIRVRVGGCTAYASIVDLHPGDETPASWNYGIELQWLPPPD